jgi:hypothetical protein
VRHDISALWESRDAKKWRDALASYWENPSVRNNLEVEKFMDKLDPEIIRKSNSEGWHGFLRVYFNLEIQRHLPREAASGLGKRTGPSSFSLSKAFFSRVIRRISEERWNERNI